MIESILVTIFILCSFVGALYYINRKFNKSAPKLEEIRQMGNENLSERLRRTGNNNRQDAVEDDDATKKDIGSVGKIGTKKRAKLEAKAEKRAQRENELRLREERKKQEELEEKERKEKEEEEEREEERKELEEKRIEEERMQKEEEEYKIMKASFCVEEEGYENDIEEDDNLLQKFMDYVKEKKVVVLEDLAAEFRLKTQAVIDRLEQLLLNGALTGVIDDRGKFVYITEDELKAVADFVKKRGRVSIQELVENSNQLIMLS